MFDLWIFEYTDLEIVSKSMSLETFDKHVFIDELTVEIYKEAWLC